VQQRDVSLEVLLRLLQDPFLEVEEVKCVRVFDLLGFDPFDEEGEVVRNLLTVEDSIHHVAAEETHLDLVTRVRVDL
jgi:hypothetical protein